MPKRVGSSEVNISSSMDRRGLESAALQGADGFQAAQHADRSVIAAGVRNGVDVRTRAHAGEAGSVPAQRANVLPTASSRTASPASRIEAFEPGARAQIRLGENNARNRRRRGIRKTPRAFPVRCVQPCVNRSSDRS